MGRGRPCRSAHCPTCRRPSRACRRRSTGTSASPTPARRPATCRSRSWAARPPRSCSRGTTTPGRPWPGACAARAPGQRSSSSACTRYRRRSTGTCWPAAGAEARGPGFVGQQELRAKPEPGAGLVQRARQPVRMTFGGRARRLVDRIGDGLVLPAVVLVDAQHVGEVVHESRIARRELPRKTGAPAEPRQSSDRHVEAVCSEVRAQFVRIRRRGDVSVRLNVRRRLGHSGVTPCCSSIA